MVWSERAYIHCQRKEGCSDYGGRPTQELLSVHSAKRKFGVSEIALGSSVDIECTVAVWPVSHLTLFQLRGWAVSPKWVGSSW